MKKFLLGLLCVVIGFFVTACGGGGGDEVAYSPPSNRSEPITLVSSRMLSDNRWEYQLAVDSNSIEGSKLMPYEMGENNGWRVENILDVNGDNKIEFTIVTFNREIRLAIGGDYSVKSWMSADLSKYFVLEDNGNGVLIISFNDGRIYTKGVIKPVAMPGVFGDDFVRFTPLDRQLVIYVNNNKLNEVIDKPFVSGNMTSWSPVNQTVVDSSGWGSITIPITVYPRDLSFSYGGNFNLNRWVTPIGSVYYDAKSNNFHVIVSKSGSV